MSQMFPAVGPEIIEGFIGDVYEDILHELPWQRSNIVGVLQTVAPYSDGTVTLTQGSNAVAGLGTAFTLAMSGRAFRLAPHDEIYEFTYVSPTAGTLDRAYEGASAAGSAFKLSQHVYVMPADCRMLENTAFSGFTFGPLDRMARNQLNATSPNRITYGTPMLWASYMDDNSTPPRIQVELYPVPDSVLSIPFTYVAEAPALSGTSITMLPWVQTSALVEGVMAKLCGLPSVKDYAGAQLHGILAKAALKVMRGAEAQGMAPAKMQLSSQYTSYRRQRGNR